MAAICSNRRHSRRVDLPTTRSGERPNDAQSLYSWPKVETIMNKKSLAQDAFSLRGKTLAISTRIRPLDTPAILSDCFLETRAGRLFLVGMGQPSRQGAKEWTAGVRQAIAWDAVEEYLVFQSPQDYY